MNGSSDRLKEHIEFKGRPDVIDEEWIRKSTNDVIMYGGPWRMDKMGDMEAKVSEIVLKWSGGKASRTVKRIISSELREWIKRNCRFNVAPEEMNDYSTVDWEQVHKDSNRALMDIYIKACRLHAGKGMEK